MAIQVRRGKKKDFDPDKMLPGEWAGTTDTKEVFFTFSPGDTKKMATYEDMAENIREATGEITAGLTEGVSTAIEQANTAADTANQAAETAQASITNLTEDVAAAIENSNTAAETATQAAQEAQDAAQEAREAASGIGSVTGVKGDKETEYRQGNINLTPEDLGALSTTGDAGNNTVTFTSNDSGPDGDHAVLEVETLTTGETLSSILQKLSRMFTNIRYLLRLVGTTDITSGASKVGDGTVTGAVRALNDTTLYSTEETPCGTWTDGKTMYRKVVDCGSAPNIEKSIPHDIQNLDTVCSMRGMMYDTLTKRAFLLPLTNADASTGITYQIRVYCDEQDIIIAAGRDYSRRYTITCIIEYTKEGS